MEERGPGRVIRAWIFLPKGSCGAQCTIKVSSGFTNVASSGANNTRMTCNFRSSIATFVPCMTGRSRELRPRNGFINGGK